jgi:hypothetical protein
MDQIGKISPEKSHFINWLANTVAAMGIGVSPMPRVVSLVSEEVRGEDEELEEVAEELLKR